ncbi:glycoside hydrolase superfamily [Tricladium varicosporioides]|nr:glycoside hydrolase superfamily [Hymenoscyphus varicosporioides]
MPSIAVISLLALGLAQPSLSWYQAQVGVPWQVVLESDIGPLDLPVDVYDIDLFTTPQATIDTLHSYGKRVLCYFSAGTYEPNRPDSDEMHKNPSDIGANMTGWPGEQWLNIRSDRIVNVMKKRIDTALEKNCDGLDPDNVDGYDNDKGGGFKPALTMDDSIAYLQKLATYAHSKGMGIGLKNAGGLVPKTSTFLDWVVNEQCVQYGECGTFRPFIDAKKPVFHIEYKNQSPDMKKNCNDPDAKGFSTVIKPDEGSIPKDLITCS